LLIFSEINFRLCFVFAAEHSSARRRLVQRARRESGVGKNSNALPKSSLGSALLRVY
jgi:hypothetical protein